MRDGTKWFRMWIITSFLSELHGLRRGLDLSKWKELLDTHGVSADLSKFTAHFESEGFPNAVIIDCTSSAQVSQMYYEWISKGIHVVTPNKKTNSGPFDQVHPRL